MIIEVLFPDAANLYGDLQNINYLQRAVKDAEVVNDLLVDEPYFVKNTPDLIYMGSMTESAQKLITDKLSAYKERINELIENGVHFLITGNALEIFGDRIITQEGAEMKCLGLFPTCAKQDMYHRFNSLYLGEYRGLDKPIVGYKSQFTHSRWDGEQGDFVFTSKRGPGLNPDIAEEGMRRNNFLATYIIGPLLVLNPYFTKLLIKELGAGDVTLPFEEAAVEAYEVRVKEYSDENTGFYY